MHAMCRATPERWVFWERGGRWPVGRRKALRWAPVVKTWKFVDKLSAALVLQYNVHNA